MRNELPIGLEQLKSQVERLERELEAQSRERAARAGALRASRRKLAIFASAVALVVVPLLAREAYAATCTRSGAFVYLTGLKYFCAEAPAIADEVNANTQAIVSLVEQKVGQLGNANLTVTGTLNAGLVRATVFDGCYFATCPAGTAPVFANVDCLSGVRVGASNKSGASGWYAHCGAGASCTTFIDLWCSAVLR